MEAGHKVMRVSDGPGEKVGMGHDRTYTLGIIREGLDGGIIKKGRDVIHC
jgi:hypothetical protein